MISTQQYVQAVGNLADSLYRIAVSILRHPADAQDALQEALMKAWQARETCRLDSIRPWLTRITINECRNIQRKRRPDIPIDGIAECPAPDQPDNEDLREAIDSLPETLRTPLLLHYMEGYPDKETAKALGISQVAVRNRIWRARRLLREQLSIQEDTVYEKV